MKIDNINLIDLLPQFLKQDATAVAMCRVLEPYFNQASLDNRLIFLYANIDSLTKQVLDELAWEFHADLYDINAPIEEKRAVLKKSVLIHKKQGTAYAVKEAITTAYNAAKVVEWWEKGFNPYTFKVYVSCPQLKGIEDLEQVYKKIISIANKTKNTRSHLTGITFFTESKATVKVTTHTTIAHTIIISPYLPQPINLQSTAKINAHIKTGQTILIKSKGD